MTSAVLAAIAVVILISNAVIHPDSVVVPEINITELNAPIKDVPVVR